MSGLERGISEQENVPSVDNAFQKLDRSHWEEDTPEPVVMSQNPAGQNLAFLGAARLPPSPRRTLEKFN
jgi:hypothetical protein